MTKERKEEIIDKLNIVYEEFELPEEQEQMTMFDLISGYNKRFKNPELIGGEWAREQCLEPLKSLP